VAVVALVEAGTDAVAIGIALDRRADENLVPDSLGAVGGAFGLRLVDPIGLAGLFQHRSDDVFVFRTLLCHSGHG